MPATTLLILTVTLSICRAQGARGVGVLTQHNDNNRTGAYLAERRLTPAAISRWCMRLKVWRPLWGEVLFAQPLYVPTVKVGPGLATKDVVYVATMSNNIYAFDVNDENSTSSYLWKDTLREPDPTHNRPYPRGILSTPVIDADAGILYAVYGTSNSYVDSTETDTEFWLVALDIASGRVLRITGINGPATNIANLAFDPTKHQNRPGLLLNHAMVYVGFGAHGHELTDSYHGWVFAYDANTFTRVAAFAFTPSTAAPGQGGGVWQGGGGLATDKAGNVVFMTGNAVADFASSPASLGNSFVRLTPSLTFGSAWTPYDRAHDPSGVFWRSDLDLGAGGPLLIPETNLLVGGGKTGILYLIQATPTAPLTRLEEFHASENIYNSHLSVTEEDQDPHLHGAPVFWRSPHSDYALIYTWGEADLLRAHKLHFPLQRFDLQPCDNSSDDMRGSNLGLTECRKDSMSGTVQAGDHYPPPTPHDRAKIMPGGILSLSANGTEAGSGVLWATLPAPRKETDPDWLFAFDAENLHLLWQTTVPSKVGHFTPITVADGKVLVATREDGLRIYELNMSKGRQDGYCATDSCVLVMIKGVPTCANAVHRIAGGNGEHVLTTATARELFRQGTQYSTFDDFFLARYPETSDLVPFYQCANPATHYHLATTDPNCEVWGPGAREYVIGFIAQTRLPGTVPLHRLRKEDHLYTINAAEVISAQTTYGYIVENDVGFVWPQAGSPVHRSIGDDNHFGEHFYTEDAEIASSFGYTPENMNVFYLRAKQEPGTRPFYQCTRVRQQVHQHFYTIDPNCELWGSQAREYPLGYIATDPLPGTVTLYRLRREDHLYTISTAEVLSAEVVYGYALENGAGYVWQKP